MLAKDRMATFQELADEAFRDLLEKHNRPVGLKSALRQSLGGSETYLHARKPNRDDSGTYLPAGPHPEDHSLKKLALPTGIEPVFQRERAASWAARRREH